MTSEPVVVFYKSITCKHCTNLTAIWDKVVAAMKNVTPIRTFTVTTKSNGPFDFKTAPKDLLTYARWFPMILLVPGRLWDEAMQNLGPDNPIGLRDGVKIFNGKMVDGIPILDYKYKVVPEDFANWLRKCLEDEDFKRVQTGQAPALPAATLTSPIISEIRNPPNSRHNYATSGDSICNMRIIPRK